MKFSEKLICVLLAATVFTYTSCKKTETTPVAANQNQGVIGSQIAMNLAQSLAGSFGGASIKDGIAASGSIVYSKSSHQLNSVGSSCGFLTDTGINYDSNSGDTIKSNTTGSIRYFFNCTNGQATSYTVLDSLITKGTAPGYNFHYSIIQDYLVGGLNPNNSRISLDGKLKSLVDIKYTTLSKNSISLHNSYVLTSLEINQDDNNDITSGTAAFVSAGSNVSGSWSYTGTITFLGNHRAKIEFLSKIYYVDLTTGQITT